MACPARLSLVLVAALLGACASGPRSLAPQAVFIDPGAKFSPSSEDVLFRAIGLVGTPYRYGGNTPDSGFDCSGLIGFVYRDAAGIRLPRSTGELVNLRAPSVSRGALQPGDLLFFATSGGRTVSHAGIYVGEGRFVHAPSSGGTVRLDRLADAYWRKSYLSAKRVLDGDHLARNP
jgi:cell wall-associated NlpC family hydrolase